MEKIRILTQLQIKKRQRLIFLVISLAMFFLDIIFVLLNTHSNHLAMEDAFEVQSQELESSFRLTTSLTYRNMIQFASFVVSSPKVQRLMAEGKAGVEAEGGGEGGVRAKRARDELRRAMLKRWEPLSKKFNLRQMHFHLGPGSLSFLRLHRPQKFGDRMDDLRYTIVDTNEEKEPRFGFETGRVYSGLRGVVPIFVGGEDGEAGSHVGALEMGTSFSNILSLIEEEMSGEMAVLLHQEHIKGAMWPEAIVRRFPEGAILGGEYIEASSASLRGILRALKIPSDPRKRMTQRIEKDGFHYLVTMLPLYDYRGELNDQPPVGFVVLSSDVTKEIILNDRSFWINLIYSFGAFFSLEIILFFGMGFVNRMMNKIINDKITEIKELNHSLEVKAVTDGLTGLHNHHFFIEHLEEEINNTRGNGAQLSMVMIDLDYFKAVNDRWGHPVGDRVLEAIAEEIKNATREGDDAGRYGGEEFSLTLPFTNLESAHAWSECLLEKIRARKVAVRGGEFISVTASIGVAEWNGSEDVGDLIARADQALYSAKDQGRDQVFCAP